MKSLSGVLCVLCVLCGSRVFALDREAFTFTHYDLNVRVEPAQQRLAVRGKVTLRNDSTVPQKDLTLQISSSLNWRSIRDQSGPLEFSQQSYTSDVDHTGALSEAIISLPKEILPGATVAFEVGYEGTIPLNSARLTRIGVPDAIARHEDWDQIADAFTAVRGIGFVAWYPIATAAANLSEKDAVVETVERWKAREASATMRLHWVYTGRTGDAPPGFLCNGKQSSNGGAEWDCEFSLLGTASPSFALGAFTITTGRLLDVYSSLDHKTEAEAIEASAEKVAPFVTAWFGNPREKPIVVELADDNAEAFESRGLLFTPLLGTDASRIELTAVRQLTHAAVVSPRLWMSEGLTHFAQALYSENRGNRAAALEFMRSHAVILPAAEKTRSASDRGQTANSLINTSSEELYRGKAMYVWWMLYDMLGESALKQALAGYHPEQDKEPSYFQRLLETQSKKDLEWFFDDWVYRDKGLPDFHIVSVYQRKNLKEGYLITALVENLGDAAAEVPVIAHTAAGDLTQRLMVRGKSQASVRFSTATLPDSITVNDGSVPESNMSNNTFKVEPAKADNN